MAPRILLHYSHMQNNTLVASLIVMFLFTTNKVILGYPLPFFIPH